MKLALPSIQYMMDIAAINRKYEEHTQKWIRFLDDYDDVSFHLRPSAHEWSVAQVIDHIYHVTVKCTENVNLCTAQKGETGHLGIGPAIFSVMGAFPPVKIKVKKIPQGLQAIYAPQQITKVEAYQKLNDAVQLMKQSIANIDKAAPNQRIKHWAGGWFNARQWFHSAEMHIKHHFRQKIRIDRYIQKLL